MSCFLRRTASRLLAGVAESLYFVDHFSEILKLSSTLKFARKFAVMILPAAGRIERFATKLHFRASYLYRYADLLSACG
jgi:hypothetical protein